MNNITHAFKTAGMRLPPLNKRIWLWLHDHAGKTYAEVATALNERPGNVSSQLGLMARRGMVSTSASERRTSKGIRITTVYATAIKAFELLPFPAASKPHKLPEPTVVPVQQAAVTVPTARPTSKAATEVLENYTLRELRAVRDALNYLFEHV